MGEEIHPSPQQKMSEKQPLSRFYTNYYGPTAYHLNPDQARYRPLEEGEDEGGLTARLAERYGGEAVFLKHYERGDRYTLIDSPTVMFNYKNSSGEDRQAFVVPVNIYTHTNPDWDALGAAWMAKQIYPVSEVNFIPADAAIPPSRFPTVAVDVGRRYENSVFDHHHDPSLPAATQLVLDYWVASADRSTYYYKYPPKNLDNLAELIDAGDRGLPLADESRREGMHAVLSAWKRERPGDQELLRRGFELLDEVATRLDRGETMQEVNAWIRQTYAKEIGEWQKFLSTLDSEAQRAVTYRSPDGAFVAVRDGSPPLTFHLLDQPETQLVLFTSRSENPTPTVAVGLQRGREVDMNCGQVVESAIAYAREIGREDMVRELESWFRHPAGFFAGRGSAKAPNPAPLEFPFEELTGLIDEVRPGKKVELQNSSSREASKDDDVSPSLGG